MTIYAAVLNKTLYLYRSPENARYKARQLAGINAPDSLVREHYYGQVADLQLARARGYAIVEDVGLGT